MIGIAALAIASCAKHDFETMTQAQIDKANYDAKFVAAFGLSFPLPREAGDRRKAPTVGRFPTLPPLRSFAEDDKRSPRRAGTSGSYGVGRGAEVRRNCFGDGGKKRA